MSNFIYLGKEHECCYRNTHKKKYQSNIFNIKKAFCISTLLFALKMLMHKIRPPNNY